MATNKKATPSLRRSVTLAIEVLRRGGVVLFPTETSYGLAADARDARAVRRVFDIKGREPGKPPPLIASDARMARDYVEIDGVLEPLVKAHWPGALTVVGKVGRGLARQAVLENGTVAVRVSSHPIARALAKGLGAPIVATSANMSGQPNCYSVRTFERQRRLAGRPEPDFVLDVGPISRRKPSTIVAAKKGRVVVLRPGSVRIES